MGNSFALPASEQPGDPVRARHDAHRLMSRDKAGGASMYRFGLDDLAPNPDLVPPRQQPGQQQPDQQQGQRTGEQNSTLEALGIQSIVKKLAAIGVNMHDIKEGDSISPEEFLVSLDRALTAMTEAPQEESELPHELKVMTAGSDDVTEAQGGGFAMSLGGRGAATDPADVRRRPSDGRAIGSSRPVFGD